MIVGTSTNDRQGCIDTDSDGWSDTDAGWDVQNGADAFENDATQWRDRDFDGYGDNILGNQPDHCPDSRGYSTSDRYGCIDSDGDSYSDADPGGLNGLEPWYAHPNGLADAFPLEITQWQDTDGDGYGDNWEDPLWNQTHLEWGIGQWLETAHQPDACPFILGVSFADRYGCPDADGDAWSDPGENWTAADGADAFPFEPTQWRDRDFDGYGDNQSEGAKLIDDFPDNPTQFRDTDFDGWGDNQTYGATQIDDFPMIPSQYRDSDGDGYGDNLTGFEGDVCMNSNAEEVESGWISRFDRPVVVMSIRMDIPIQPMIGLRTHKGLLMPSRTMLHNGTIPTTTDLVIIWNISMVKHGASLTVVMDARPPMASRHLTDGAARISMKMDGRTPHRTGSLVLVVQRMLGQRIQPNGMTVMVMAEGTTPLAQPLMFAHPNPEPLLAQAQEATAGVAQIQMVTVGRILVMRSFMNQHNGEIRTATVTVTKPMEMRQMHVQRSANFNP